MPDTTRSRASSVRPSLDRLGALVTLCVVLALWLAPFVSVRANRIVAGQPLTAIEALPVSAAAALWAVVLIVAAVALLVRSPWIRLITSVGGLLSLSVTVGFAASVLTPAGDSFARVSPASGFWFLTLGMALLAADSVTRLNFTPGLRLAALALAALALWLVIASGAWDDLSLMKEYASRSDSFGGAVRQHLVLALGSLAGAVITGVPLGILCHRLPALRALILPALNVIQTIPSIALFGILMVPLGFLAATVPLAYAMGVRGIGTAPAVIALFLYSLLPIVANTAVGLAQVSPSVVDAARGMGMSRWQRLFAIEIPLALPVVLAGIRIVLVQNLGLAAVAALIGGGGLGTFIFQGIGQTAIDLVLLGALPIVLMAFVAAIVLDAMVDLAGGARA
ncbi:ABC transporter permease [Chelatococcus asaccharovorans]|uniref:Osmoprotectant transport system permease protein n=1 Tax=Chelatococcus asaccharovorans TaxID=28210 RepID=A0A2V3TZV1_9HYPH|nr:ABC transporter permease [Chelatococcus asaccharovorans]MBS7707791.1 ABC transporter permease [Chelatococcus asaccharovorans]PXW55088.1 osmoprotectant transport system permease protein [Chelatococcus asaccharovorans]